MGKPSQDLSKKINITNALPSLLEDKKKLSQSPFHNYDIMLPFGFLVLQKPTLLLKLFIQGRLIEHKLSAGNIKTNKTQSLEIF